jgi:tRNA (cytosine38-C5)-methyltransferase
MLLLLLLSWLSSAEALSALEFYSGIGGLRAGLLCATQQNAARVMQAYDINTAANTVYEHVYKGDSVLCKSIEHVEGAQLQAADLWLMSPPCQPFTRIGNQQDLQDTRSVSFLHLMSTLEAMAAPPRYLFLENVRGFELSDGHARLTDVLVRKGYTVQQFMLSPTQIGIPNTRLRYYCLARLDSPAAGELQPLQCEFPGAKACTEPQTVARYIEQLSAQDLQQYLVEEKVLAAAQLHPLDVCTAASTETITFTKGYGKQIGRSGPLLLLAGSEGSSISTDYIPRFQRITSGQRLRYFTPTEMLKIAGFPDYYSFPASTSRAAAYRLIGNSVNVAVVTRLLAWLLRDEPCVSSSSSASTT